MFTQFIDAYGTKVQELHEVQLKLLFQEGTICNAKGRTCADREASKTYGCKTSCKGIYADVQWIDEDVGRSKDGGMEESQEAFYSLVEEYREYKKNYARTFRFLASADSVEDNFGKYRQYMIK